MILLVGRIGLRPAAGGVLGLEDQIEAFVYRVQAALVLGDAVGPGKKAYFRGGCAVVERAAEFFDVAGKCLCRVVLILYPAPSTSCQERTLAMISWALSELNQSSGFWE